VWRIVKLILSIVIFPIGIYHLLHILAGKIALLPASTPSICRVTKDDLDWLRVQTLGGEWKYKRISVEVDGYIIDAVVMGKEATLGNGRWMAAGFGNGEFYEHRLWRHDIKQVLTKIEGNAIYFNYPGVSASSSLPSRSAMAKAYAAMLAFLEDKEKGIGAREIIGFGHSIGGAAQSEALNMHELKEGIKYTFVKSRTFSDLGSTAGAMTCRPLGWLVRLLNWNMSCTKSSKALKAPEIIMQTANVDKYEELKDSSKIVDDGLLPAEITLAKVLLDDPDCPKDNKIFIGVPENHMDNMRQPDFLAEKIEECLAR